MWCFLEVHWNELEQEHGQTSVRLCQGSGLCLWKDYFITEGDVFIPDDQFSFLEQTCCPFHF
jgi:hypothetical protein